MQLFKFVLVMLCVGSSLAITCHTCIEYKVLNTEVTPRMKAKFDNVIRESVRKYQSAVRSIVMKNTECSGYREATSDCGDGFCVGSITYACLDGGGTFVLDMRFCDTDPSHFMYSTCKKIPHEDDGAAWRCECDDDDRCNGQELLSREAKEFTCEDDFDYDHAQRVKISPALYFCVFIRLVVMI